MPATFTINALPVADLQSPNDANGRLARMTMSPGSGWTSPRMVVTWTYSGTEASQPQTKYELEIRRSSTPTASGGAASGTILVSGEVTGAATTATPTPSTDYIEGNYYFVRLRVHDGLEWSAWDGWYECRVRWGLTTHAAEVIGGAVPTSWSVSALSTDETATNDLALEYNSSTAGGAPPDPWEADLSAVTKRAWVHYRVWFFAWGSSPATRPKLLDLSVQASGLVLHPDFWLPVPLSGMGGSIEIGRYAFGGQCLRMDGDGTEQVIAQQVRVEPNTDYMLQGRVESIGNSGARIQLSETETGASIFSTTAKTADASFAEGPNVQGPWNSAGRAAVWVQCRVSGAAGTSGFFDGVMISKGTVAPPWTPTHIGVVPGQLGSASVVDAGGVQVDASYGGVFRLRTVNGNVVDLGDDGLELDGVPYSTGAGGVDSGSSFPGSPADNDLFYRTDLDLLFFWNGTRWLSVTLYYLPLGGGPEALLPSAASFVSGWSAAPPLSGGSDIWLVGLETFFYVGGGATALGASHKWVGIFQKMPLAGGGGSAVSVTTVNVDSGASDSMRTDAQTIGALLNNGTSHVAVRVSWTKTGTPGTLRTANTLTYRLVAT